MIQWKIQTDLLKYISWSPHDWNGKAQKHLISTALQWPPKSFHLRKNICLAGKGRKGYKAENCILSLKMYIVSTTCWNSNSDNNKKHDEIEMRQLTWIFLLSTFKSWCTYWEDVDFLKMANDQNESWSYTRSKWASIHL